MNNKTSINIYLSTIEYKKQTKQTRRRGRARNGKLTWTNNEVKLPQSVKGNRLLGSPGSPESQRNWTQGGAHQGTS